MEHKKPTRENVCVFFYAGQEMLTWKHSILEQRVTDFSQTFILVDGITLKKIENT